MLAIHPPGLKNLAGSRWRLAQVPETISLGNPIDTQTLIDEEKTPRTSVVSIDRRPDIEVDDEDEREEEEEHIQPFLKEALVEPFHPYRPGAGSPMSSRSSSSRAVRSWMWTPLDLKENSNITKQGKLFCLSTYKSAEACSVFFSKADLGLLQEGGTADRPLSELCTPERLYHKKKGLYAITLSIGQTFILENNGYCYHLRLVPRQESPKVTLTADPEVPFYKSLIKSSGIHVVLMVLLSLFLAIPEMPGPGSLNPILSKSTPASWGNQSLQKQNPNPLYPKRPASPSP